MNKQQVIELLRTNDRAIIRAVLAITARQTDDEQASEQTKYSNGRGWKSCHGQVGTSMAKFYQSRGYLTARQIAYWRRENAKGQMRIECYANQLLQVIKEKEDANRQERV